MLDVRTNILLDKERYSLLLQHAKRSNTSIGELIRRAIDEKYKNSDKEIIRRRTEAFNKIMEIRKRTKLLPKNYDYKKLINWKRRY